MSGELKLISDGSEVVARGTHKQVEWVALRAPIFNAVNGYVRVPDGHPWFDAEEYLNLGVPYGECAYQEGNWFGFDTLHAGQYWPDQAALGTFMRAEVLMTDDLAIEWTKHAAHHAQSIIDGGSYAI